MKKLVIGILAVANLAAFFVFLSILNHGEATQLTISDLQSGPVDINGDGKYTFGDDWVLQYQLAHHPHYVEEALKVAKLNPDGGIDLSPYFMSEQFDGIAIYHERYGDQKK